MGDIPFCKMRVQEQYSALKEAIKWVWCVFANTSRSEYSFGFLMGNYFIILSQKILICSAEVDSGIVFPALVIGHMKDPIGGYGQGCGM